MARLPKSTRWIVLTLIAAKVFSLPARASTLEYWDFNPDSSRLEIITDKAVQPKAQLIGNPTRLAIDLPGISVHNASSKKDITSFVEEVRVAQFSPWTTRIVVELGDDYIVRPWEVKVKGLAPNRWFVQLPKFLPVSSYSLPSDSVAISVPTPKPYPKTRLVILVDPGHGGKDPGAIGIGGLQEKGIVLSIGLEVARILEQRGIRAILTRTGDRYVSLGNRVAQGERVNAAAFVSIHANSIGLSQPQVNGLETYYYDTGYSLARSIHRSILRRMNVRDRGVKRARFYVLRKSSMPAALVEVGFVTGSVDSRNLSNANYRKQMAEAIALGIINALQ